MKRFVLVVLCGLVSFTVHAQDSSEGVDRATLYYDAPSGEVFVNIEKENELFEGIEFRSKGAQIQTDNYLRIGEPTVIYRLREDYLVDSAGIGSFRPAGFYALGAIYPANLSEDDFTDDITAKWGGAGVPSRLFESIEFSRPSGVPRNDPNLPKLQDSWASAGTLTYVAPTGELIMDLGGDDGGFITAFSIKTSMDAIQTDELLSVGAAVFESDEGRLQGAGVMGGQSYSFGNVLPANLSSDDFVASISEALFLGEAGVGAINFDLGASQAAASFSLVHIPEPHAAWMLVIGVGVLGLFRRRAN